MHLSGYPCYEGESTQADSFTNTVTFSYSAKGTTIADCVTLETSSMDFSKCGYIVVALEVSSVSGYGFLNCTYTVKAQP